MDANKNIVKNAIASGIVTEIEGEFAVPCSLCLKIRMLKTRENVRRALKYNKKCNSCSQRIIKTGKKLSENHKIAMSISQKIRYSNINEREMARKIAKECMHRPDVRKRHIEALHHSKWIKVRTDKGQLELMDKWNKLGFVFEPNYQIHTSEDLFYIDCFDKIHNVVLEYDGKYHMKLKQKKLDLIRQNKIIKFLNPKVFWRYNSVTKKLDDVYRSKNNFNKKTVPVGIENKE